MYRYDLSGKLVHSYVYDNESMRTVNGVKLRYDDESRLTEESFSYDYNHVGGSATDNYSYLYEYHETMGNVDRMQIFGVGVEGNLYYIVLFKRCPQSKECAEPSVSRRWQTTMRRDRDRLKI